jgi:hypothetical protein
MDKLHDILPVVFGSVVTFLVPAIVWTMLVAGCYQLIRDKIRQWRILTHEAQRLAQKPMN